MHCLSAWNKKQINNKCLPDFNIIDDQELGNCPYNSLYLGEAGEGAPTSINGSSLNELCLSTEFDTLTSDNCKNLFTGDNLEGRCPWIGYDLFHGKSGVGFNYFVGFKPE